MISPLAVRIFFFSLCLKCLHRKPGVKLENGESKRIKLDKESGQTQGGRAGDDTDQTTEQKHFQGAPMTRRSA